MNRQHLLVLLTSKPPGRGGLLLPVKVRGPSAVERQEFVTRWAADPLAGHAWLTARCVVDAKGKAILAAEDAEAATTWDRQTLARTVERILAAPAPTPEPSEE